MPAENGTPAGDDAFVTTELAERLSGPEGAAFARETKERLEELRARVEAAMRVGVPQGQLDRYRQVSEALASAASVVILASDARTRQGVPGRARSC